MDVRRILAGLAAVPLVLLAVLLGACGSGGSSVADPPVSSAPTTSDATTKPQHETAEHFIQRWADAEQRMEVTGKSSPYIALTDSCEACTSLVRDVRRYYASGGFVHWNGLKVLSVEPTGKHAFRVKTDSTPTHYRESSTGPIHTLDGGVTFESVTLKSVGNSWRVTARARLAQ
jgi:hypothetical protein